MILQMMCMLKGINHPHAKFQVNILKKSYWKIPSKESVDAKCKVSEKSTKIREACRT